MPNTQTVPGSLMAVATAANASLAESFLSVDLLVIVDTSGSMSSEDAADGKQRYIVACKELEQLQATRPGKIGVISFSDSTVFCPGGIPTFQGAGTDLAGALRFVKAADDCGIKLIVISDGEPEDKRAALEVARKFTTPIDVIYVGPDGGPGSKFLADLAKAAGGQAVTADLGKDLGKSVQYLLASHPA